MGIGMVELTTINGKSLVHWETIKSIATTTKSNDYPQYNDFPVIVRCVVGTFTDHHRCVESVEAIEQRIVLAKLNEQKQPQQKTDDAEKIITGSDLTQKEQNEVRHERKMQLIGITIAIGTLIEKGFTHPVLEGMESNRGKIGFIMEKMLEIPSEFVHAALNEAGI